MSTETLKMQALDEHFLRKVFYGFVAIALTALALNLAGRYFGRSIALGGHTASTIRYEVVIGNDVVVAPANAIRFAQSRRDGVAPKLELYLHWPDMTGFTRENETDFNAPGGQQDLVFLSFEPRAMSRDMSGRFEPIYRSLVEWPGRADESGIALHAFTERSGYLGEELAVLDRPAAEPLVARCVTGQAAAEMLAPCERDIQVGDDLSLVYRFPRALLADWPALEAAVRAKALEMVRTKPR